MVSGVNKSIKNKNTDSPVLGIMLIGLAAYLYILNNRLNENTMPYSPQAQSL